MKSIIFYDGDGKTKTFGFGFSFFQPADIIVEINGEPATIQYALDIGRPNKTADMPYSGGVVCFATAPVPGDEIKIYREFVLTRPVDYQPTAKPKSHEMNQDSNFHLENIRDLRHGHKRTDATVKHHDEILNQHDKTITQHGEMLTQYGDKLNNHEDRITKLENQPSRDPSEPGAVDPTPTFDPTEIENKIAALESNIKTLTAQLETYATTSDVEQMQTQVSALENRCENLDDRIADIGNIALPDDMDYVVESQMPTAENNYTWYRKYASGWVEQGGIIPQASTHTIDLIFPVEMANENYNWSIGIASTSSNGMSYRIISCWSMTTTSVRINTDGNFNKSWFICGMAATE